MRCADSNRVFAPAWILVSSKRYRSDRGKQCTLRACEPMQEPDSGLLTAGLLFVPWAETAAARSRTAAAATVGLARRSIALKGGICVPDWSGETSHATKCASSECISRDDRSHKAIQYPISDLRSNSPMPYQVRILVCPSLATKLNCLISWEWTRRYKTKKEAAGPMGT